MSVSKQRTKVVVRRLPPGLTEDAFKSTIDKIIPDSRYNYFAYFQGKVSLRKTVLSRAYINFIDPTDVFLFKSKFDGHVFITTKGSQFKCSVEYAPFQKVPNPPKKKNPLEGTIDQDPHYQEFLKHLESGPELLPSAAVQREQEEKAAAANAAAGAQDGGVKVTPLMEYLRNKYASNPGLRLGGARRNKGKTTAAPPPPKAGRGSGRGAPATKGGSAKPGLWEQPIPEEGGPVSTPSGGSKPSGGSGRGGGRQQQGRGPGPAPPPASSSSSAAAAAAAAAAQQQQPRVSEKVGAGRGAGPSPAASSRPASAAVPTAAGAKAGGAPVKVMARPGTQQQQQQQQPVAAPSAATVRPAQPATPAAAAAPRAGEVGQGPAAAPSAAATGGGAADAQQQQPRPQRERRVRAGFQPFQPRRRGAEDNDYG